MKKYTYAWYYVVRKNRRPSIEYHYYLSANALIGAGCIVYNIAKTNDHYDLSFHQIDKPVLTSPFTVEDIHGKQIFTLTNEAHIATVMRNMMLSDGDDGIAFTPEMLYDCISELKSERANLDVCTGVEGAAMFNEVMQTNPPKP